MSEAGKQAGDSVAEHNEAACPVVEAVEQIGSE